VKPKRGTVVLTPFPFADLSGSKVRPAVVVSRRNLPGTDVILAFITGQPSTRSVPTDLVIAETHPDFASTGLKRRSTVKLDKLVTVQSSLLLGEIGSLSAALLLELNDKLRHALDL
jgi:mRNA interferase MazF